MCVGEGLVDGVEGVFRGVEGGKWVRILRGLIWIFGELDVKGGL